MAVYSKNIGVPPRRLSTAVQFFEEDEFNEEFIKMSTSEKVVELLNQASLVSSAQDKVSRLKQVQELIVRKDPDLLDNFLDEVIAFQNDHCIDVRKCIIGFMEETCKVDVSYLTRVMPCIIHLLQDDNVNIQKKIILTFISLYRHALQWVSKSKVVSPEMHAAWEQVQQVKSLLLDFIDADNDGVRTHVVKLLEGLTLTLSKKTRKEGVMKEAEASNAKKHGAFVLSLDQLTESNRLVRLKNLESEGDCHFMCLVRFQRSTYVSSINLMTVMGALANIARQRPVFFDQVVQSFEALNVNLPPTLAKSQVMSVRKNLKLHMLSLLRHCLVPSLIPQITTLLTDLGTSQSEISKTTPREEVLKRKLDDAGVFSKKPRMDPMVVTDVVVAVDETQFKMKGMLTSSLMSRTTAAPDDDDDNGMSSGLDRSKDLPTATQQTAIDITAEDVMPHLTVDHVADLVLLSMVMLPDTMPAQFQSAYTPIAAAGTQSQIKHVSRLLATQLTIAGIGKGVSETHQQVRQMADSTSVTSTSEESFSNRNQSIQTVVGLTTGEQEKEKSRVRGKDPVPLIPMAPVPRKGLKQFRLDQVTKPLKAAEVESLSTLLFTRILSAERMSAVHRIHSAHSKILIYLASTFGGCLRDMLEDHILGDVRSRAELAFTWLYQEYVNSRGYNQLGKMSNIRSYKDCFTRLLKAFVSMPDQNDGFFHRLILHAPQITKHAMTVVRHYCMTEKHEESAMKLLYELVTLRPKYRFEFLGMILTFTCSEHEELFTPAIEVTIKLYSNNLLKNPIAAFAVKQLKSLLSERPPVISGLLGSESAAESTEVTGWSEDAIKKQLYLYLGLLPGNHTLIHELANVYTATSADIKRAILRVLEVPVKGMGMDSPELLTLVENCPKGSETLVMRVIHILTDKAVPSPELVERIRDLYHKRVPDVRFLIPVLNGLSKKEVTNALPKLIKLNPMVVKEVFNRIMGAHRSSNTSHVSPLSPDDLLVALHNIDPNKSDMKTIIKAANLCFGERGVYTQEVLAIVMQRLMEQTPLSTLLMRTVIQSLSMYPRLLGFVLNILNRLVIKKVWTQQKVWEGFVKCCQRTKPQSFQVLLQLPPLQLLSVFRASPELRLPLLMHVRGFSQHQLAHVSSEIMSVLEDEQVLSEQRDSVDRSLSQSEPAGSARSLDDAMPLAEIRSISTIGSDARPLEPFTGGDSPVMSIVNPGRRSGPWRPPEVGPQPQSSDRQPAESSEDVRVKSEPRSPSRDGYLRRRDMAGNKENGQSRINRGRDAFGRHGESLYSRSRDDRSRDFSGQRGNLHRGRENLSRRRDRDDSPYRRGRNVSRFREGRDRSRTRDRDRPRHPRDEDNSSHSHNRSRETSSHSKHGRVESRGESSHRKEALPDGAEKVKTRQLSDTVKTSTSADVTQKLENVIESRSDKPAVQSSQDQTKVEVSDDVTLKVPDDEAGSKQ